MNGRKLKRFCGVRARLDIPITIKSWNSQRDAAKLEKLKDELFIMIQVLKVCIHIIIFDNGRNKMIHNLVC